MIISDKQLLQLIGILYDRFRSYVNIESMFGIKLEDRVILYNIIINQQSEELKEINGNS